MINISKLNYIKEIQENSMSYLKSFSIYIDNAINMNTIVVFFSIFIMSVIFVLLYNIIIYFGEGEKNKKANRMNENTMIEYIYMIIPLIIVYFLIITSIGSIYMLDEYHDTIYNLNIKGSQWKWDYSLEFITKKDDLDQNLSN